MKAPSWKDVQGVLQRTQAVPAAPPAAAFWAQFRAQAALHPQRATPPVPAADWGYTGWAWAAAAAVIALAAVTVVLMRQTPMPTDGNPPTAPSMAMRAPPPLPPTPQAADPEVKIAGTQTRPGPGPEAPSAPAVAAAAPAAEKPLSSVESVDVQVEYRSVMIVQDEAHGGTLVWLAGVDDSR